MSIAATFRKRNAPRSAYGDIAPGGHSPHGGHDADAEEDDDELCAGPRPLSRDALASVRDVSPALLIITGIICYES